MKCFHPARHALHAPSWYLADGSARPCPETPARVEAILQTLRDNNHEIIAIPAPESSKRTPTNLARLLSQIHAPDYLRYLRTIHPLWKREFDTDVIPDTFFRARSPRPPAKPAAQTGYYCFDLAAPITAGTWTAALSAASAAVAAADAILHGQRAAYALCRPPGHHAGPDYCGGFCYLNNIALAAQHLLNSGHKKIAILDLDYHHGNGTQDIFYRRKDVLFVSVHADPDFQYPYFWGHAREKGEGPGKGYTLNLPLPRKASAQKWLAAFTTAIAHLQRYRPDALLISLGTDIHQHDPVGDFRLNDLQFQRIGEALRALHLPTVLFQEGGYNCDTVGPCVAATLGAF